MTLHVAFVHAFVNPALFLVLHKGLRRATADLLCCNFRGGDADLLEREREEDEECGGYDRSGNGGGGGGSPHTPLDGFVPPQLDGYAPPPLASINRTYM